MGGTTYIREAGALPAEVIEFPDAEGDTEALIVTDLGDGMFRLEESPVFSGFAGWSDVMLCSRGDDGRLICQEVVQPSGLHRVCWVTNHEYLQSRNWAELKPRIMAAGGVWQQVFGGILILHYPKEKIAEFEPFLRVEDSDGCGGG
jgi:hypothetical protein